MSESGSTESNLWYEETYTTGERYVRRVKRFIVSKQTQFQRVDIVETYLYGKTLYLDGKLQSAEKDEFVYHEALVHPALLTSEGRNKVLVIGGGEGAVLRELVRYPDVDDIYMVDIDRELVSLCKEYLPEWSMGAFEDPRVHLIFDDGRKFIEEEGRFYDVILLDLSEPYTDSPSIKLFTKEFYSLVKERLVQGGVVIVHAGTTHPEYMGFFRAVYNTLKTVFEITRPYEIMVPSFTLPWGFVYASRERDPLRDLKRDIPKGLKFYDILTHQKMFSTSKWFRESLKKESGIITDENPYIWNF